MKEMEHPILDIVERNRVDGSPGIYSVCSAHPDVLEASLSYARDNGESLCLETTSNQVNQFGGYTGMTPGYFARTIRERAATLGFDPKRLWLGGDHLGPDPWRRESGRTAMGKAADLVRAYVKAGYTKIHLDTSMACGDDPPVPLDERIIAERTAVMAAASESAFDASGRTGPRPLYVIGTEVPVPGGHQGEEQSLHITTPEEAESTIYTIRRAFLRAKLEKAWDRVRALVVQPGVEFGDATIHRYDPEKSKELTTALDGFPRLIYEAHSTDYQDGTALRALVENHFAILKVGPWFSFNLREAFFSLSYIEDELIPVKRNIVPSRFREILVKTALSDPQHWKGYYSGNDEEILFALKYSLSDRIRYYWNNPGIMASVDKMIRNLDTAGIPRSLRHQFFPDCENLPIEVLTPRSLIRTRIQEINDLYSKACVK